jgi:hypothetical protein
MGKKYSFVVSGIDVDDIKIDEEVNRAVEKFAKKRNIEHYLLVDYFDEDPGVRIILEDIGE